ncbi:integrase [Photobacterium damselae]|uniref:integrase n=1 Tax=Photobacterium damselae TaxID=38293 RepID=UPI001110DB82|nr:integrase [Photobacterium damselae]TMX46559.1 integrase [Photobacterium damselae]TMX63164.1 integrase [Photobacterium damselae]
MFEGVKERFKQKNIDRFLKQLFPFDESYNALIATEVIRLCAVIRKEYRDEFSEIPFLISEAQRVQRPPASTNLHDIVISISNNKNLGVHYLPAFLSSSLLLTSYDRKKFDQYKALTFLSVARLSFIGTHRSKVEAICNDVRLFANGKRETMAAYLPDIEQLNFHQLVEAFQTLVDEDNEDRPPNQVVDKLNHYRRPYESTLNYSDGYTRNVTSSEFRKSGRLQQGELKKLDDDGDEGLFELTQFKEGPKSTSYSWQKEDHHGESSRTTSIVSSYTSTQQSYVAGALHARAIQARIEKRDMSLACDIDSATTYEIGALVRYCTEQISRNSKTLMAAKLLLVMLLSGSTYHQAIKLKSKRSSNKNLIGFCRKHKLPSQKQRAELLTLLTQTAEDFWLPLPKLVCQKLSSLSFKGLEEQELKELLSHINKRHDTHLTLRRVSSYLRQKLSHENIDSTIIALLAGEPTNTIPALFYLQLSNEYLLQTYNRYLEFLSQLAAEPSALTLFDEFPAPSALGSPLYIESDVLSSLFSHLKTTLNKEEQANERYHNDITIYTQLVLAIASGYRPVTGWFGKITHLSLQTGDYWISDKESGIGDNSRVIKLPEIAIKILDNYLSYCKRRFLQIANTQPELSLEYQRLLTGDTHLFFYLRDGRCETCTPSNYTFFIDSVFPLPANWARHHVRTLLTAKGVDISVINAWMGHMNQSKRSFHEFSALTRQQMVTASNILNQHLLDIGVEAIYD